MSSAADEDRIRQLLVDIRLFEGSARILQARLDAVAAAIGEVTVAHSTLEGVKTQSEGGDTLIPLGAGSFLRAKLTDIQKVIMGVGAGVALEKSVDDSITELRSRLEQLAKARDSLQQQLAQAVGKLEEERAQLSDMVGKRGGGTVAFV